MDSARLTQFFSASKSIMLPCQTRHGTMKRRRSCGQWLVQLIIVHNCDVFRVDVLGKPLAVLASVLASASDELILLVIY